MANPTDPPDWVKENQGKAKEAFDRAQVAKQALPEKIDSQQVKNSAPGMHLRPTGPARAGPDAQAHVNAMAKDDAAAKEARDRSSATQNPPHKGDDGKER